MRMFDSIAGLSGSGFGWIIGSIVAIFCLYMARVPAHRVILSLSRLLYRSLRMSAKAVRRAEIRMVARNREVLLQAGREAAERIIEREFERIDASVKRDLSTCPALFRKVSEQATHIEEDLTKSKEVPPSPPGWVGAVKAVAEIETKGDPMAAKILESIQGTLSKAHDQATADYRDATQARHKHLQTMAPYWRKATEALGEAERKVGSILQRSKAIDRHMDEYQNIVKKSDRAERTLSSSSLVNFFVAAFVLAIATGGALINFNLIARPMSEMVGGNNYVAGFKVADVAALVIILVEMSMGLFLMESLRITRLFPVIAALTDKTRVRMIWITLTLLTLLATVEAGLAYLREVLMHDQMATSAMLRGEGGSNKMPFGWITIAAQMGMGFILPYALTFVAIPLETFVHSLRTVVGVSTCFGLRALATVLRTLGTGISQGGRLLVDGYDLVIFAPLWLENMIRGARGGRRSPPPEMRLGGGPGGLGTLGAGD
jgi:hypothetical protein